MRTGSNTEKQKATDSNNRKNEEKAGTKGNQDRFISKTDELLKKEFKGFDFKVGEKKEKKKGKRRKRKMRIRKRDKNKKKEKKSKMKRLEKVKKKQECIENKEVMVKVGR